MKNISAASRRSFNFDLFKIVLMYSIVVFHVISVGGGITYSEPFSFRYELYCIIYIATGYAVNAYALITGYFGVEERKTKHTNLAMLWLQAFWYGAIITLCFIIFMPESVGLKQYIYVAFPVTGRAYWYLTAYFMLYLFKPILNSAFRIMGQKRMGALLILLISAISIPAMLNRDAFGMSKGFSPWWLMIMYLIGGYIRKYGLLTKIKTAWLWCIYFLMILLDFIKRYIYERLYFNFKGEMPFYENAMNYMAFTMVVSAVCLLLIFERVKIKEGKTAKRIQKLSAKSFSIYLIHVNRLVWDYLLKDNFRFIARTNTALSVLELLAISGVIFAACIIIDIPREVIFDKFKLKKKISDLEEKVIVQLKSKVLVEK